jgi:hypothetical protein
VAVAQHVTRATVSVVGVDDDLDARGTGGVRVLAGHHVHVEGLGPLGATVADDRNVQRAVLLAGAESLDAGIEVAISASFCFMPAE